MRTIVEYNTFNEFICYLTIFLKTYISVNDQNVVRIKLFTHLQRMS